MSERDTSMVERRTVRVARQWLPAMVLAAGILAGSRWMLGSEQPTAMLMAGLGDTIAEVAARSSYPLNTAILHDDDLSTADRPVIFHYMGPGGFELPPTRVVTLTSTATVVTGIRMAPQLEYLGPDGVRALAQDIEPRLLAAGWKPDPAARGLTSWDNLARIMADPSEPEVTSRHLAIFRRGEAELLFRLRRLHRVLPGLLKGAFLLNLEWSDDRLIQRAEAVMEQLRREDGITTAIMSRPVEASLYSARVRALLPR